jgi:hypothetical protein
MRPVDQHATQEVRAILNWFGELKRQ